MNRKLKTASSSPREDNNLKTTFWQPANNENAFEFHATCGVMAMFWDIVSEVAASSRKTHILRVLATGAGDQRTISRLTGIEQSNASKALIELCKAGLAECMTPNRPKARIYRMTPLGNQVHDKLTTIFHGGRSK